MAQDNIVGGKFQIDVSDLKKGLADANRQIKLSNSEFQAAAAGMGDWTKSEEGLNAKIKQLNTNVDLQSAKVNALTSEYEAVAKEKGENSKEAQNLKIRLNAETKALKETEAQLDGAKQALKDFGNEAEDAGDASSGFTDKLKNMAGGLGNVVKGVGVAAAGLVTAFLATGEASQETIAAMGKLETAFTSAGHSTETAEKTFNNLVGILGETDQAVEAASHLALLTDSEEELAKWTDISAGIYGKFGASLPIEGLTEAANHTAKLGEVQGPLADALEWVGKSTDDFNVELAKCNSEEERAALITATLSEAYGEAGRSYQETNKDLIESRQATANMTNAIAELGKIAMPIMTMLKNVATDLLTALTPAIETFSKGLVQGLNGADDAFIDLSIGIEEMLKTLAQKMIDALPLLVNMAIQMIFGIQEAIRDAFPAIIDAIVALIPTIIEQLNWWLPFIIEVGVEIILAIVEGLGVAIPMLVTAVIGMVPQIVQALADAIPLLIDGALQFFLAMIDAIPTVLAALMDALPKVIHTIIDAVVDAIPQLLDAAITLLMAIIDAIPTILDLLVENLPKIITMITDTLVNNLPLVIGAAITLFEGLVKAIPTIVKQLVKNMPQIISAILKAITDAAPKLFSAGADLIKGVWDGIASVKDWLLEKISGFFGGVVDSIKDFFGIASPSKKMASWIGKPMAQGVGVGFDKEMPNVKKGIQKSLDMDLSVSNSTGNINSSTTPASTGNNIYFTQYNNSPKALSRLEIYRQTNNALALLQGG